MAINYKIEQLSNEIYDIARREHDMTSVVAVLDNKHEDDTGMILKITGNDIGLFFVASNMLYEAMKQYNLSKWKLFRYMNAGIDYFVRSENTNE